MPIFICVVSKYRISMDIQRVSARSLKKNIELMLNLYKFAAMPAGYEWKCTNFHKLQSRMNAVETLQSLINRSYHVIIHAQQINFRRR